MQGGWRGWRKQCGDLVGIETIVVVADLIVDYHFSMFAQDRDHFLASECAQHVAYLVPILRAMILRRLRIEQANRFLREYARQQIDRRHDGKLARRHGFHR